MLCGSGAQTLVADVALVLVLFISMEPVSRHTGPDHLVLFLMMRISLLSLVSINPETGLTFGSGCSEGTR